MYAHAHTHTHTQIQLNQLALHSTRNTKSTTPQLKKKNTHFFLKSKVDSGCNAYSQEKIGRSKGSY